MRTSCCLALMVVTLGSVAGAQSPTIDRATFDPDVREPRPTPVARDNLLNIIPSVSTGREWLKGHGVQFRLIYRGELGIAPAAERPPDFRGMGLVSVGVELNSERLGLWTGGRALLLFRATHGEGLSLSVLGTAQCVSNLEAPQVQQISAAWLSQEFLNGALWLKVGKQDANAVFASSEQASSFLHSSAGYSPSIPLASYPDPEWGVVVAARPRAGFALTLGGFQGEPDGQRSLSDSFQRLRGPMLIAQADAAVKTAGRDGSFSLGVWWNGGAGAPAERQFVSQGAYFMVDQWLWRGGSAEAPTGAGLFLLVAAGTAPGFDFEQSLAFGLRWVGPIASRPRDVFGLAAYQVRLRADGDGTPRAETALEALATVSVSGWLTLKSSLQVVFEPGGRGPPKPVLLERVVVSF